MKAVPVASELEAGLRATLVELDPTGLTAETIAEVRGHMPSNWPDADDMPANPAVEISEHLAPGPAGGPPIAVTVFAPRGHAARLAAGGAPVPGLLNIHGGGMMVGHRMMDAPRLEHLVEELGVVAATVEYRLAPEHPHPAPVEDCYAALCWFAQQAAFGIDPARIVVMGGSAGGGLSAGVALMARDRKDVALAGQLLLCPMIDDRNASVSSRQYQSDTVWTRANNELGWSSLLGAAKGTADVSYYAAPARAQDHTGLPPAYIEAGSAEIFRDEDVEYASRIWAVGGSAELHIWSGGFHGFDFFVPEAEISRAAVAARLSWLKRTLKL